jgi:hypothetical protein
MSPLQLYSKPPIECPPASRRLPIIEPPRLGHCDEHDRSMDALQRLAQDTRHVAGQMPGERALLRTRPIRHAARRFSSAKASATSRRTIATTRNPTAEVADSHDSGARSACQLARSS